MEREIFIDVDLAPHFLELTDEEAGKVVKAIFQFSCHGEEPDF